MFLITEKSRFLMPGVRASGSVLPTLPKVKFGGLTNCEVSNHCEGVRLSSLALIPVEFGRVDRKLFAPRTISGKPLSNTRTPSTCHPPIRMFRKAFEARHLFCG